MSFLENAGENKVENEKSFWREGFWRGFWKTENVSAENKVENDSLKSGDSDDHCLRKDFIKCFQLASVQDVCFHPKKNLLGEK